jgi:VCBS repeat-containing protein
LGSLSITAAGTWTYTVANADVQYLDEGVEKVETFTVLTSDGTEQNIVVTITGVEDGATVSGDAVGAVTEDATTLTLSDTGALVVVDADQGEAVFQTDSSSITSSAGALGSLSITAAGTWTYTVANADVQDLDEGAEKVETFTVLTADGTEQNIVVTITGTDDVAELTSDTGSLTETDAAQTTSGTLTLTDIDTTDATVVLQANSPGTYGTFSVNSDGAWTYKMTANDQLDEGQVVTDSFDVATTDGGSSTVTITITGTNDIAEIGVAELDGIVTVEGGAYAQYEVFTGTGASTITTGAGDDFIKSDTAAASTIVAGEGNNVIETGVGIDTINTGSGDDRILSGDGASTVTTTGGDNVIIAGLGVDTIVVGDGADTILTGDGASTVTGTGGDKKILTGDGVDTITVTDGDNLIVTGEAASTIVATHGNNVVCGGSDVDTVTLGDGNNIVAAGDGANTIVVGHGENVVWGGDGIDTITGGGGGNYIDGGDGDNTLTSGAGNDTVISGDDIDTIVTAGGDDLILVKGGSDVIAAGTGSDTLVVDYSDATTDITTAITAGGTLAAGYAGTLAGNGTATFAGVETFDITSGAGDDNITGGDGDDTIDTGTGVDVVFAGGGSDYIYGNGGDTIDGGEGGPTDSDTLNLGFGNEENTVITYTTDPNDPLNLSGSVEFSDGSILSFTNIENIVFEVPKEPTITLREPEPDMCMVEDSYEGQSTGGTLVLTDPDTTNDATVVAQTGVAGSLGVFSIDVAGVWTYTTSAAVNELAAGQEVTEQFSVTTTDGGEATVTVAVLGRNEAAIITVTDGAVTEDGSTTFTGTATATDVDNTDNVFREVASATLSDSGYGTYTMDTAGVWTYVLSNDHADVQALEAGETMDDTITVMSEGGTAETVTVVITGVDEAPTPVLEVKGTSAADETVQGTGNDESIIGGVGNDTLIGGAGDDIFVWNLSEDAGTSGVPADDHISDFGDGNDSILLNDLLDPASFGDSASLSVALADFMAITDDGGSTLISIASGGADSQVDQVITLENVSIADLGASGDQASMIQDLLDAGKLHVDV